MQTHYSVVQKTLVVETVRPQISVFVAPSPDECRLLTETLAVSERNLGAALENDSLARVEFDLSHIAMIVKWPKTRRIDSRSEFSVGTMGLFLYESRLVVVLPEPLSILDGVRLGEVTAPASLLVHLVGNIATMFESTLADMIRNYEELEHRLARTQENRYMLHLFQLEKSLIYFLNALHGNSAALERFRAIAQRFVGNHDDLAELGDVILSNGQCLRMAEIHSSLLSSLVAARLSIVSNNLGSLMKTLNLITIGIMVPTFVVSLFSMNVKIPMSHSGSAFQIVLILSLVSAALFLLGWHLITQRQDR
jgi:magnesium transporter